MSVGHVRLSLTFSSFFSRVAQWQRLDGHTPTTNLNVDHATAAVSPKFDPNYWVMVIYLIGCCWSCAPSLSFSSFFSHRALSTNALTGSIPSEISRLTRLEYMYASSYWVLPMCFIEYWSCAPSLSLSRGLSFICSNLSYNYQLAGTIPARISALVKLTTLWVLTSFFSVDQSLSAFWV